MLLKALEALRYYLHCVRVPGRYMLLDASVSSKT
jgi:hypothetical protein